MAGSANQINDKNKLGTDNVYAASSTYNAIDTQISQRLNDVETTFLARVDSCATAAAGGAKTVNATPLTAQVDATNNAQAVPSYQALPHYRLQAGIAAIVLNPVAGDIGVFSCAKRDISNISSGTSTPQVPASFRAFNGADAVMVGTVHTKAPTVYIQLNQDNSIYIEAPAGVTINTAANVTVNASNVAINATETTISGHVTIKGGLNVSGGAGAAVDGSLSTTGDVTASGISLTGHVHTGDSGGTTSAPR